MSILIGLLLICTAWAITASMLIAGNLAKRGLPVNYFLLRLMILKYIGQYNKITRNEIGHTGPLYYHFIIPMNLALSLTIVIIYTSLR